MISKEARSVTVTGRTLINIYNLFENGRGSDAVAPMILIGELMVES